MLWLIENWIVPIPSILDVVVPSARVTCGFFLDVQGFILVNS